MISSPFPTPHLKHSPFCIGTVSVKPICHPHLNAVACSSVYLRVHWILFFLSETMRSELLVKLKTAQMTCVWMEKVHPLEAMPAQCTCSVDIFKSKCHSDLLVEACQEFLSRIDIIYGRILYTWKNIRQRSRHSLALSPANLGNSSFGTGTDLENMAESVSRESKPGAGWSWGIPVTGCVGEDQRIPTPAEQPARWSLCRPCPARPRQQWRGVQIDPPGRRLESKRCAGLSPVAERALSSPSIAASSMSLWSCTKPRGRSTYPASSSSSPETRRTGSPSLPWTCVEVIDIYKSSSLAENWRVSASAAARRWSSRIKKGLPQTRRLWIPIITTTLSAVSQLIGTSQFT